MTADDLVIYGAGGFAREVAWLVECVSATKPVRIVAFIDDNDERCGGEINGIGVCSLAEVVTSHPNAGVVAAIGAPFAREEVTRKAGSVGLTPRTIVHPNVVLSRLIEVGEGTVICAGSILTVNIKLGKYVQINLACTVGHDVTIGDYTTLAPGVHISGRVELGRGVYVGTGAAIVNGTEHRPLRIGDNAVVGAGACVVDDIPPGTVVVGVPARPIRL